MRAGTGALARTWPLWPVLLLLVVFMAVPVGQILLVSAVDRQGDWSLGHYARLFSSRTYLRILLNTFEVSAWTTLICLVLGYPVAYALANAGRGRRGIIALLVLLPFWTSFLVRTFAWIIMLGRNGLVSQVGGWFGITDIPQLIYNEVGVLIGMTHALMPIAILTMSSVMEGIPKDLTRAAGTLGARGGQAFLRIYLPLSMPGVAAAGLTVFISALGFFITPALLGGARDTMITQVIIDNVQTMLNWGFASAIATLLLLATLVVFVLYDRVIGLSTLSGERSSSAAKPPGPVSRLLRAGAERVLAGLGWVSDLASRGRDRLAGGPAVREGGAAFTLGVFLVLAFLVLPSLVVIPVSFTESAFLEWPPKGFTLKWYEDFFQSPVWLGAAWRSLVVGLAAAALAVLIGAPAAFVLVKQDFRLRGAVLAFMLLPMILPRMIIALALFYFFAKIGLVGSTVGLVLSHVVLAVPYVIITMIAVLKSHDGRLEQAAGTLGARPWQAVRLITIPLIRPGLISSFLFAFVVSFDELTVALFVTGGLSATLPKQMWDDALLKVSPLLAAVSTVVLIGVTLVVLVGEFFRRKSVQRTLGER